MDVEIVEQPPLRVHALRNAAGESIPDTYQRLWTWQYSQGHSSLVLYPIGICHGGPGAITYHAGLVLAEPVAVSHGIELMNLPGGLYARTRHVGPYDVIASVFRDVIETWLPASGYVRDQRPALEFCRNSPQTTPPKDLITDLMIPVMRDPAA